MILKTLTLLQEYLDEAFDAAERSLLSLIKEVKLFLGQYNIIFYAPVILGRGTFVSKAGSKPGVESC